MQSLRIGSGELSNVSTCRACVCARLNWVCARFLSIAAVHKPFGHFVRPLGVSSQSMVPHLASRLDFTKVVASRGMRDRGGLLGTEP